MRRLAALTLSLLTASCAVSEGIDPNAAPTTVADASTTTIAVDQRIRLDALDVVGRFMDAVLARDSVAVASLGTDPPAGIQEDLDAWANSIGLVGGSYTIEAERFTTTTAEIDVRLNLDLLEVGPWVFTTTVSLVGGDPWSALWSRTVLHPSLQPGDVLRVDRQWLPRASILARDDTELAGAEEIQVIGVVPAWIEDLDALTNDLRRLAGIDAAKVAQELARPGVQPDWFVPVGSIKQVVYAAIGTDLEALPGVLLRSGSQRLPYRTDFAAHLVGASGPITAEQLETLGYPYGPTDTVGRTGIEAAFEARLAGRPRTTIVRVNKFGRIVDELLTVEAVEPEPVRTTIDVDVQTAIESALRDEPLPTAVVVLEASTGEVLGIASRPLDDGFNRAVLGAYPPGSTFKIVTATALLSHGYAPTTEVACPGRVTIDGRAFRNAGDRDLGTVDFTQAFAESCNTTFAAATAADLDAAVLGATAATFGFGVDPILGIPSSAPTYPVPVDTADLAASAIGQGRVLTSPVHMASVAGAIAAGSWRAPTVIRKADRTAGVELDPAITAAVADMMLAVVETGTGTNAAVPGVAVHAKTGSAEFGTGDSIATHAWFVGYWDGMAIAVLVEGGGGGGSVAAPIARRVIAELSG